MKSVDFGLNIGAGYQIKIGIETQYKLGLANMKDGNGEFKTNPFQILVSYKF